MQPKQKLIICSLVSIAIITAIPYSTIASDANPPELTVEGCIEKTGMSEEKCTEMIENMKNMKPGEKGEMRQGGPGGSFRSKENAPSLGSSEKNNGNIVERELEMAKIMKSEETKRFSRIETRIEKIIEFLKSKDIDTGTIEIDLEGFRDRTDAISSALDTYIEILEGLNSDGTTEISDEAKESRDNTRSLIKDLKSFYSNTLRVDIKTQIEKLSD